MKNLQRYLGINLAILVLYTVFCKVINMKDSESLGYAILMLFFVGGQSSINLIVAMVQFSNGDREKGKTLLLCAGVTLVIGFSACVGGTSSLLK